jgi:DNA-binding transcriptional regulator YiaG
MCASFGRTYMPGSRRIAMRALHPRDTSRIINAVTANEVWRLRRRLGLTQAQLGDLVGVARNSVARWERGEMGIRETAARLVRLLAEQRKPRRR